MLIALYLAAIVAANLLVVAFGPPVTIINAFLFIGLDLTTRDALHEQWRGRGLRRRMALLIATGAVLSWLLNRNAGPIALASCVAFAACGVGDALTYHLLRDRAYVMRTNGSNIVGAALDSLIFPTVAFGDLLPWVVVGQFIAKVAGGFVWSVLLHGYARKAAHE